MSELSVQESENEGSEDDCEITDCEEEPVEIDSCAFKILMAGSRKYNPIDQTFKYQRGSEISLRSHQRKVKQNSENYKAAMGVPTLENYFGPKEELVLPLSTESKCHLEQSAAIQLLEKTIRSKKFNISMNGQTLMRHQTVLVFLRIQQRKQEGDSRESMAAMTSRCFGRGVYFARRIVTWEIEWLREKQIPEGKRGCFTKSQSWFRDEGVQQAVRNWLASHSGDDKL